MVKTRWEDSECRSRTRGHAREYFGTVPQWMVYTGEREQITLPSALKQEEIDCLLLNDIATIEFELRKGQVADALDKLHLALSEKSLCFCTEVHNVDSQRTTSRAWDNIHKLDTEA